MFVWLVHRITVFRLSTRQPWKGWKVVARAFSPGRTNATTTVGQTTERSRRI